MQRAAEARIHKVSHTVSWGGGVSRHAGGWEKKAGVDSSGVKPHKGRWEVRAGQTVVESGRGPRGKLW